MTAARSGQPELTPAERRRALRVSTFEALSAQSHSALTGLGVGGNAITTGFALMLGARDFSLGLVAAIPALANCVQLLSAALAPRLSSRRTWVAATSLIARVAFPACALLPLLDLSAGLRLA